MNYIVAKKPGKLLLLTSCFVLMHFFLPVNADDGKDTVHTLVELFLAWSHQYNKKISIAAANYIDYSTMAEYAVGETWWNKLSATQKNQLSNMLQKLVEQHYFPRWHKIFYGEHLNILNQTTAGDEVIVHSQLVAGKEEETVIWKLHPKNGELKVFDLSVDGRGLLDRLSGRFAKRLSKSGFKGLISWIQHKLEDETLEP